MGGGGASHLGSSDYLLRWADIDEATVEVEQHAGGAACAGMRAATQIIVQLEALATAAGLDVPPAQENVVYAPQAPQHRELFEGYFGDMSSPTAGLSEAYFLLYTSCVMWVGVVSVGLGSEAVFGTLMVRLMSNADGSQRSAGGVVGGQRLWQMAQLLFSLNILVAFFSRSALGLPFLVLGLWKLGFPETLVSLQLAGQVASGRCRRRCGLSTSSTASPRCYTTPLQPSSYGAGPAD